MTPSKSELRTTARERRAQLASACPDFAARLARHADALALAQGTIVAGYHAKPDEADPALLLAALVGTGCHAAFPRVTGDGQALAFHLVPDGEALSPGRFAIHEPAPHFPFARPGIVLVPLLAYDAEGTRLGQGGGFYDRTLAMLRCPAIGIAYAGQKMDFLPRGAHDYPLDFLLTEQGLVRFR